MHARFPGVTRWALGRDPSDDPRTQHIWGFPAQGQKLGALDQNGFIPRWSLLVCREFVSSLSTLDDQSQIPARFYE